MTAEEMLLIALVVTALAVALIGLVLTLDALDTLRASARAEHLRPRLSSEDGRSPSSEPKPSMARRLSEARPELRDPARHC